MFKHASRGFDGIAGAALFCLDHETSQLADFSQHCLFHFLGLMAHDSDDRLRVEGLGRSYDVRDQRHAGDAFYDIAQEEEVDVAVTENSPGFSLQFLGASALDACVVAFPGRLRINVRPEARV